ncbi:hypothetical protein GCM10023206_32910 [Acinetobacter puyangensis]|uniref:DUF6160 domain-containing protein n=1 Tax=Acinetobacter puyangensis TaxID=1096779 RepID=A0A240EDL8_9GAMM|nr:DUF6160 family protein [Acinetobacter puyangensis]SNX46792.1 hypothetical protein SAMN05421731_1207 [Acinetobacter puyangensis]
MKLFTKIALVSAMAMSANAMASQLQALDDETLSATTGQDGIHIAITTPATGITIDKINIHDTDGITTNDVAGSNQTSAGAITLGNHFTTGNVFKLDTNGGDIGIDIDAGSSGTNPTLNIKVSLPDDIKITTGDIGVAVSGGASTYGTAATSTTNHVKILDSMDITLGESALNIQLGHEDQGAFIKLTSEIVGGLTIDNLKLNDTNGSSASTTGGSLFVQNVKVTGANNTLVVDLDVDIDDNGLFIKNNSTATHDVILTGVSVGTGPAVTGTAGSYSYDYTAATAKIGDVELLGLNTAGTSVRISGK